MISARDHVAHLAAMDAIAYVDRFRRRLGDSAEDAAWFESAWRRAADDACLTDDEAPNLLPLYRRALRRGTDRLTGST
jgi:hypothetical protein